MKSVIIDEDAIKKSCEFPCLRKHRVTGSLVLFIEDNSGTIIYCDDPNKIGHYSDGWACYNDYAIWTPINAITIKFEM